MNLGRLIQATHGTKYSLIRVTWMTKIFVIGTVLFFFIQVAGGVIMAGGYRLELGENIMIAAFFL
jgi:RTA1 like protein